MYNINYTTRLRINNSRIRDQKLQINLLKTFIFYFKQIQKPITYIYI